MADFNFNIKLGVDDSEVLSSIRRLDAESKRVASKSSQQVASAPPIQQNLSRVSTSDRNVAATGAGRIAAANAQVQKQQARALGLDAPSLNKIRAASVDSFKASFKGFDLLPKSQQTAIVKRFSKSFDTFFADFDRQLSKIKPTRIGTAVRDLYNREVQAVVGAKAATAKTVPAKTLVRQAEAAAAPTPRAPSPSERRASTAREVAPSTTNRTRTRRTRSTNDFAPQDLVGSEAEIGGGKAVAYPFSQRITKQNARTDSYGRPVGRSSAVAKGRSREERLQAQLERGKVRRELEPTFKKLLTPDFLSGFENPDTAKVVKRGLKKTLTAFPQLAPSQLGTFSATDKPQKVIGTTYTRGTRASGFMNPANMGLAMRRDLSPASAMSVLTHELGHVGDFKVDQATGSRGSVRARVKERLEARGANIFGPRTGPNGGLLNAVEPKSVIGLGRTAEALRLSTSKTKSGNISLKEVSKIMPSIRSIEDLKDFVASSNAVAMKTTGLKTGPFGITPKGRLKAQTLQEYLGRDNPLYKDAAKKRSKLAAGTSEYGASNLFETIAEAINIRTAIPLGKGSPSTMAGDVSSEILKELTGLNVEELNSQLDQLAASLRETVAQVTGLQGETPRATGPKATTGPSGPASTGAKTTGSNATGSKAPTTGPKATGPAATGTKATGATGAKTTSNISAAEKNLIKALNDKVNALNKQTELIKNVYAGFSKAERGIISSLDNKSKALDKQTELLKTIYANFAKAERGLVSSLTSKATAAKKVSAMPALPAPGGAGRGTGAGKDLEDLLDGENLSPYEAAAAAAKQNAENMTNIAGGVMGGDPEELVPNAGMAEAYAQYIKALIEAKTAFMQESLGLVKAIAKARTEASLYAQKLANQVLALQNADPAFIGAAAEGQVLKAEQRVGVGAAAQTAYGPRLADADILAAQNRANRRRLALERVAAAKGDTSRVSTGKERIAAARGAVAGALAPGDEQAIANERKRQVNQIREGVKAAVQLDPKDALLSLKNIKKQLDDLQADIKDDVSITINDEAAAAKLKLLILDADALKLKITELEGIGKNAPKNLATSLDTPKDSTSKDIKDLTKRANLIKSNVRDAASLSTSDPALAKQALTQSRLSALSLRKERNDLLSSAGGYTGLTKKQKVEYDALSLSIAKVTRAQQQLKQELDKPGTVNAAQRAAKLRQEIVKEETLLGKISKEKDPTKRAQQLKDLDDRVKKLDAQKVDIDTSVDPQAQIELDRLNTQIGILNSKRIAVASGAVVGGGGGAGTGGGPAVVGGAGGAGRGGQRGDIVSRVRGLGGAAGFFGSGALSTLRYSIPSALLFGAATGIASSIKEAEQLQFNLAKIESQIKSTFGEDAAAVTQQFKQQIMDVSLETGLAADELALLTVQLIGAFSTAGEIEGLSGVGLVNAQIESAAKIAQATGLPLTEITDGLTAASIAFSASFKKIGDVAIGLEQKSGVLAKETISFIGDIAPVATEAGFSLEEFSAIAAIAQQRSGRGGAALAEQFGRIIPAIYQSRQALLDIAVTNTALGTPEFFTAINNSDTRGILFGIGKAFNSLNKESKDFVVNLLGGRREAAAILPALSNPQALQSLTKAANNSAGKLEERFKKVQATLTNTFQRLNEQVRKLFLTLLESGLEDLLKEIAGLLGIIAKGFGLVFKAVSPVLGAFDGLPLKILAAVAAFKLLRAAMRFGPGGGIGGFFANQKNPATSTLGNLRATRLQGQAAAGTISPAQRAQAAAVFNAMSGYGLPGYGNVNPYGLNPNTGKYSAPGMLGGNIKPTARQAYQNAGGGVSGTAAGARQGVKNVGTAFKAGAGLTSGAVGLLGGGSGLALTGAFIAYGILQDRFDKERAELDKLNAFANDANNSIEELRAKALDLRETNAGIGFSTQLAGFFTGNRYESAAEYAEGLVFAREAFDDQQKRIIEILSTQGDVVTYFLEQSGKIKSPRYFKQQTDGDDSELRGISDYQVKDILKSRDKAVLKTGPYKDKIDVRRYIRSRYGSDTAVRQGQTLGESDIFQAEKTAAEQGSEISKAVVERVNKLAEVAGVATDDLYTSVFDALGTSNPAAKLNEIAQDEGGKYSEEVQAQAAKVANEIGAKSKDDPRVKAILEANGLLDDAAAATLKSIDQLQKDLDIGRIAPSTYLSGIDQLIQSTLTAISKSSGNQKVLYESLLNLLKLRNDFINNQAQETLTSVLDVLNVTTDQTSVSGISQKAAAIQAFINSGITGDQLRKAALDLIQTQQDLAIALIQNADTSEEAFAIASRPIEIPIETRIAAIRGRLQALVGNWSTFAKGWEDAFGETADNFITFITTALANGSMSIDQVKAILEERKKQLELQKQGYLAARTFIGARDAAGNLVPDQVSQGFDQNIAGVDAIINSINTTGQLPGDPGSQLQNKKAFLQAAQQRSQAATNLKKAKANKDSVARAVLDAAQAEDEYQKAVALGLDDQTLEDLDAKRRDAKQAVIDAAKGVADAVRGIARAQAAANKDSVAGAVADLDQATADYNAAIAAGDKEGAANAISAQIAARAAIRDSLIARQRTFAQLLKTLGSQDSIDQAEYDVNIAKMNMANAIGPEERMQAWMELIAAERAQREAFKRRREALIDLAKTQTEDPVEDAKLDLQLAQQLIAEAKTNDERIAAQKALVEAQRAMTNAMNDVRSSQFNLRQAELNAIGDDIGAAQVAAAAAREQLQQAISAGKGTAEINNLRVSVINAEKAARDAIFQGKLDEYKYLLDTDQITKSEYANYLEGLKSTLIPGTKQFKDLEITIKNLKDDISGNLQTNLPTSLMLPTLYEVRRLNQAGQYGNVAGGANGPSVGYQDNRNIQVQVVVNNGMSEGQVVDALSKAMNVGTSGYDNKKY